MGNRSKPNETIAKLREVEVRLNQGDTMGQAVAPSASLSRRTIVEVKSIAVWGGGDQAQRWNNLENENQRLRWAVSNLTLDKPILREAAKGNF